MPVVRFSWLRFAWTIALYAAPAIAIIAVLQLFVGWLADSLWEETAVYFLAQAIPAVIVITIGGLQGAFGPDWREGMRVHMNRMAERERIIEEGDWERPHALWWPPRDMAPDGSCPRLGLESDHMIAMRQRWPAWFAKHERHQ